MAPKGSRMPQEPHSRQSATPPHTGGTRTSRPAWGPSQRSETRSCGPYGTRRSRDRGIWGSSSSVSFAHMASIRSKTCPSRAVILFEGLDTAGFPPWRVAGVPGASFSTGLNHTRNHLGCQWGSKRGFRGLETGILTGRLLLAKVDPLGGFHDRPHSQTPSPQTS